jgi:pyruvate/2-oxoglutarate dehydrogenase complex dihydrolipoamide dehydrogenase (E3) component
MERMRRLRAEIADNDSAQRFAHKLGVDVFLGEGKFIAKNMVEVNGKQLKFAKAVIATGGSPGLPHIPGILEMYSMQSQERPLILTNENLFNLTELPSRLAVIGAGVVGMEMAQAFQRWVGGGHSLLLRLPMGRWARRYLPSWSDADSMRVAGCRLGSQVAVFARRGRVLPKEDEDVARMLQEVLAAEGVSFHLDCQSYDCIVAGTHGGATLAFTTAAQGQLTLSFDAILVAAGRKPNVR